MQLREAGRQAIKIKCRWMQCQMAVEWRESEGILQLGKVELLPNTFKQKCTKSKYSTEAVCHSMISHNNIGKN